MLVENSSFYFGRYAGSLSAQIILICFDEYPAPSRHVVKHGLDLGLDWTYKLWTGLAKHGLDL